MGEAVLGHPLYGSDRIGLRKVQFWFTTPGPNLPIRGHLGPDAALKENVLQKYLVKGVFII